MSLFPCITDTDNSLELSNLKVGQQKDDIATDTSAEWLKNASFKAELVSTHEPRFDDREATPQQHSVSSGSRETTPVKHSSDERKDSPLQKEVKKKRKKERSSKSHKRKKKSYRYERQRSKTPVKLVPPPNKIFLEEMRDLGYADAYRLDRKRDRDNYSYGSLNKNHLSAYRCISKVPYGLTRSQAAAWRTNKHFKPSRYFSKEVRSDSYRHGDVISTTSCRLVEPLPQVISLPPLTASRPGEKSDYNPLGILDESTELWNQGKAPADKKSENLPADSYLSSTIAQKIASYNKELRENPGDISLWLKLVNVQDGLLQQRTEDESSRLFTDQLVHEKKISIIQQALKHNTGNLQLQLKELELNSKTMEWAEINEQWRKLTFAHVNDVKVWKGYLHHVKSSFNKFTVGLMVKAYTKCLKSLRQVSQGMLKSHLCKPNTVEHMIEILLELCDLLHLANCTEKAVAIVQAMIEFNLHRPSSLDSHDGAIQSFQEFYDLGLPRFGEPGAKGWCHASTSQPSVVPAPLKPTVAQDEEEEERVLAQCQTTNRTTSWLLLERSRQTSHWLPWKPAANETDEDCEDPHRLVLSDDIIDMLFYVEDEGLRSRSYVQFLHWLGLKSKHVLVEQLLSGTNQLHVTSTSRCDTLQWHEYLLNDLFISHCTEQMLNALPHEKKSPLIASKISYQLQQILRIDDKKERKRKGKEFKNYVKCVLSLEENRNDQSLWLAFADCNRKLGQQADMNQVLNVLMNSQTSSANSSDRLSTIRCLVWWQVVQGAMEQDQPSQELILSACCWLICGGAVTTSPSPSQKLMLIRQLETDLQQSWEKLSSAPGSRERGLSEFTYLVTCYYTTLVLLRDLSELEQAVHHWTPHIANLNGVDKGELDRYYTRVVHVLKYVHRHLYQSCTPLLRGFLQTSLNDLPSSEQLLAEYLGVERSSHVVTRVRQFFTSQLSVDSDVGAKAKEMLAVYSVLFELDQLEKLQAQEGSNRGINNRIRSLCGRCLNTLCPDSVLLWRIYMYHEAKYGERTRLESIFYAAVQACPYAKAIYTDGIEHMPDLLAKIVGIAEDKEIRIHTPLEELDILLHQDTDT